MEQFGPIDHFIGHSLGGITISLIAETIDNPTHHKFVLLAPATKTSTTFERYFNIYCFQCRGMKWDIHRMVQFFPAQTGILQIRIAIFYYYSAIF